MARASITWGVGGDARVESIAGVRVVLQSSRPFPPGAPVNGTLSGDSAHAFVLKVTGSRRRDDGAFEVRGRLVTATTRVIAAFTEAAAVP